MRDPKRIPRILNLLEEYWSRYPDLRLGQIVGNFTPPFETTADGRKLSSPGNSYNVEDEVIEQKMFEHLHQLLTPTIHRERAPEKYKGKFKTVPVVGEIIWVPHGDDHHAGWGIVSVVKDGISGGEPTIYVSVEELPAMSYNWVYLEPKQAKLRKDYPHRAKEDDR